MEGAKVAFMPAIDHARDRLRAEHVTSGIKASDEANGAASQGEADGKKNQIIESLQQMLISHVKER